MSLVGHPQCLSVSTRMLGRQRGSSSSDAPAPEPFGTIRIAAAGLFSLLAACGTSALGPPESLDVELSFSDESLLPWDTTTVTLLITNPSDNEVQLESTTSCLAVPEVYHSGRLVAWPNTGWVCQGPPRVFSVPAGQGLMRDYELVAHDAAVLCCGFPPHPQPPGRYTLRLAMYVDLPDVEQEFVVEETHPPQLDLTISPVEVSQEADQTVSFRILNPNDEARILLGGPTSCVALPSVLDPSGRRLQWRGTGVSCFGMGQTYFLGPGEQLVRTFLLTASVQEGQAPWAWLPPAPGAYTLHASVEVSQLVAGGRIDFPDLTTPFEVRAP